MYADSQVIFFGSINCDYKHKQAGKVKNHKLHRVKNKSIKWQFTIRLVWIFILIYFAQLSGSIFGRNSKLPRTTDLLSLQARVIDCFELPAVDILRRGRRNHYSEARELFCYLAARELGFSGAKVGAMIGMGKSSVSRAVRRGEELFALRPVLREWWKSIKQLRPPKFTLLYDSCL